MVIKAKGADNTRPELARLVLAESLIGPVETMHGLPLCSNRGPSKLKTPFKALSQFLRGNQLDSCHHPGDAELHMFSSGNVIEDEKYTHTIPTSTSQPIGLGKVK